MKAWRVTRHGGSEVLQYVETPQLKPASHQALIQVEAVGLNHLDVWVRKGVPGHQFHLPITPGGDIAGTIKEFGPGSEQNPALRGLKVGAPILVNPGLSCGACQACLTGNDPLCSSYGIVGETVDGGCADEVLVPITNLIPRPPTVSAEAGASLSIPYLTAWTMLSQKAKLQAGETILIQAGGSGVSIAAIQMAKMLGATVLTTVGSEDKVAPAKALGADHVIQYRKTPFRAEVRKLLEARGKKGCDVVLDHVGADTFADSLKCLGRGGRFVTCGATTGGNVQIDLKAVFFKNLSILGSTMGSKGDFLKIVDWVAAGQLKPVIDQVLPMKDLPRALELLENRNVFGKIVLKQS